MVGNILANNFKVVEGNNLVDTALTATNFPGSGSFVDIRGIERFHVLIHMGTIHASDVPVFEIKEAESVSGTPDVIDATNAKHTAAADDDGEFVSFTIETAKLSDDHDWVTCVVSGVANGSFANIEFLLEAVQRPVTQTTAVLPTASQHNHTG